MGNKGLFICVEGLDGCGKTTQTNLLVKTLNKMTYNAVYTTEPSRGNIGKFIRKYCLHGKGRISVVTEALLFAADRYEHIENEVTPELKTEKIVVSDRYVYSSLAYQGAAGLDLKWIETINKHAIKPDLAVFLDVKPEIVVKRLKPKKSVMENLETQRKVREVYVKLVENGELVRIDGNKSEQDVADAIIKVTLECIRNRG